MSYPRRRSIELFSCLDLYTWVGCTATERWFNWDTASRFGKQVPSRNREPYEDRQKFGAMKS